MRVERRVEKRAVSVSPACLSGMLALQRYRLLSFVQFAKASGLAVSHVRGLLRLLERKGYLGAIGNTGLRGGAKSPKLYYLTRQGYALLCEAGGFAAHEIGGFVRPHTGTRWSPVMAHRMAVVDMLLAVEVGAAQLSDYRLVATFHEYRRKQGRPETSDLVCDTAATQERIVPDAGFVLENQSQQTRGLFLIEIDRGTERIVSHRPQAYSIADKFRLYERYLRGGRFRKSYAAYGDFGFFTLLFVSTSATRIENCRDMSKVLDPALHPYFRLGVFKNVVRNPFSPVWLCRDVATNRYTNIIRQRGE